MMDLFEDGDWRLVEDRMWGCSIHHHCPDGRDERWWYTDVEGLARCGACNDPVPKALIGLRNLHRWDR